MPPQDASRYAGYQYNAMSSLVTTADRSLRDRRGDNEPTGEAESLAGRFSAKDMGTRAVRGGEGLDVEERRKKNEEKERKRAERQEGGRGGAGRKERIAGGKRYGDVLEATQDLEGLDYRPRTAETRAVYELILSAVHSLLGDTPPAMVRSAADMILGYLKDDSLKDLDKKREIDSLLSSNVGNETFAQLVTLGKKITDYGDEEKGEGAAGEEGDAAAGTIDDDVGVAVVFEEEEDEEDEEGEGFEVRDEGDDTDDEEEEERIAGAAGERDGEDDPMVSGAMSDDEGDAVVIGGGGADASTSKAQDKAKDGEVPAREIDGFWLQRLFASAYPDAVEAAQKTEAAMALLEGDGTTRDVENALMDLTEYDKFELVATLVRNREKVVWCTRLARTDEDGRMDVEVAMREKGCGWILKELKGDAGKNKNAMDVDGGASTIKPAADSKKGTLAPGSLAPPPRKTVDLESMSFSQGARLMSNKKVKLPEGSFKRSKKGYEEVHVPAPKPQPLKEGELVPVTDLPEWAREAFKGNPTLNRVQSRLYPVAFGTDEPLLLCAPTGAGKTNVAMLTILNELAKHRNPSTGEFDFSAFKIVYIAPMKALVQEMVGNFSSRLKPFNITVNELTGDRQLTKQQIAETQIIVTTPEKWDVITRKSTDTSYTNLVSLIIIDEIHLLHDERGPVLEAIVARTLG